MSRTTDDEGNVYGGLDCPHCGEFIDNDYIDMVDETAGGYLLCPHCGEEV